MFRQIAQPDPDLVDAPPYPTKSKPGSMPPRPKLPQPGGMQRREPVKCVVCQDAGVLIALRGDQGTARIIASNPDPLGVGPDRLLIKCPQCGTGNAAPVNHFARLEQYPHQIEAIAAAKELALANQPTGWLVLVGGYGSGKSTLALATARTLQSRGVHIRTYTAAELKDEMFSGFRSGNYGAWLRSLKEARGLLIDELDSVKWGNEQVEEMFSELINARYSQAARNLTILVSADVAALPGRIQSRMAHYGPYDLGEIDLRQPDPWGRGDEGVWK